MKNELEIIIVRVLQKDVTEEEMRIFSSWFYASEENKNLFFQMKQIFDNRKENLPADERFDVDAGWERLRKKLHESAVQNKSVTAPKTILRLNRWMIAVAAVFIGLIAVGSILFYAKVNQSDLWVEVRTEFRDEPKLIQLHDGSTVQLNASSVLKYPKKFKKNQREVYLDGEALFDVVKAEKSPFLVRGGKQVIRVLGTRFSVMNYSGDVYSVTTLISGKVSLETFDEENNPDQRIVINPDQQLRFNKHTGQVTLNDVDAAEAASWVNGTYAFYDEPLELITERLEKYYGVNIVIPDEFSRNEKYTGKFTSKQQIDEIIKIINFEDQFHTIFKGDTIVLQRNK